jgi:hypothetical protein
MSIIRGILKFITANPYCNALRHKKTELEPYQKWRGISSKYCCVKRKKQKNMNNAIQT